MTSCHAEPYPRSFSFGDPRKCLKQAPFKPGLSLYDSLVPTPCSEICTSSHRASASLSAFCRGAQGAEVLGPIGLPGAPSGLAFPSLRSDQASGNMVSPADSADWTSERSPCMHVQSISNRCPSVEACQASLDDSFLACCRTMLWPLLGSDSMAWLKQCRCRRVAYPPLQLLRLHMSMPSPRRRLRYPLPPSNLPDLWP